MTCRKRGEHFCQPRADHAQKFMEELLVHTKGSFARRAFILADWQRDGIVRPLFGTVRWSAEHGCYVRRFTVAWIEIARKNGKALDVSTPVLTGNGWRKMGELAVGDLVHAADGSLAPVAFVSERHHRDSYLVRFADGAELVASDHHLWAVNDRLKHGAKRQRVIDTAELYRTQTCGARGDRRYTVTVPDAIQRPWADLPLDPYLLGSWLGDGTASRAEFTSADPELWDAITGAGFELSYDYPAGNARTRGVRGMVRILREMGVLGAKHTPSRYLLASEDQRLELLRGLMDTDGSVIVGRNTPRVEFCNTSKTLANDVLFLARSLGWKASIKESRATIRGRDCGARYRVTWTAYRDRSPFRLARKADLLAAAPTRPTRAATNAIVSVAKVDPVESVCIQIDHPSHVFLAGESLTPTHNTELLAAIMLYLLVADSEESAEIYGVARDRDQAALCFDVAARMVQLSPILSKRLSIKAVNRRIVDARTGSVYAVIAADAAGALGSNPSAVAADEILAWRDRSMWDAMRTGMGSGARQQPLMVAATTAGNDPAGFAAAMHNEMQRVADDPSRAPHVFVFMRNTPKDADPWDEKNWAYANPALGDFKSLSGMREQAVEARNDPAAENAFRQFQLNQWVSQASRWMPMHLYSASSGEPWLSPDQRREELKGRVAYCGLDLAAKFDLTAWCLVVPFSDDACDVLWRFWLPEGALTELDRRNSGHVTAWVKQGWITLTDGDVIDYQQVYADIGADAEHFAIKAGGADRWSMAPVIQEVAARTSLVVDEALVMIDQGYKGMTPGLVELMGLVKQERFCHHNNPVAAWCFDNVEVRRAPYDPELIRPDKPERGSTGKRIDAVPAAAMAVDAWRLRSAPKSTGSVYDRREVLVL